MLNAFLVLLCGCLLYLMCSEPPRLSDYEGEDDDN